MNLIIGSHVSFKKDDQLLGSVKEALSYGSNCFMFYTGAPQNTRRKLVEDMNIPQGTAFMVKNNLSKMVVHAPYIINLANNKEIDKFNFSVEFLKEEIERCYLLGIKYMVLHPGSHVGLGVDVGIKNIIDGLNQIVVDTSVIILLETMAGKGSEIGVNFQEIKKIITGVKSKKNIGVCLDTCHLNDAGYDVKNFDTLLDYLQSKEDQRCFHSVDELDIIQGHTYQIRGSEWDVEDKFKW